MKSNIFLTICINQMQEVGQASVIQYWFSVISSKAQARIRSFWGVSLHPAEHVAQIA